MVAGRPHIVTQSMCLPRNSFCLHLSAGSAYKDMHRRKISEFCNNAGKRSDRAAAAQTTDGRVSGRAGIGGNVEEVPLLYNLFYGLFIPARYSFTYPTERHTMPIEDGRSGIHRRSGVDRRCGWDTRSEEEQRAVGERRSGRDRRLEQDGRASQRRRPDYGEPPKES
jgi:hypothetical protein